MPLVFIYNHALFTTYTTLLAVRGASTTQLKRDLCGDDNFEPFDSEEATTLKALFDEYSETGFHIWADYLVPRIRGHKRTISRKSRKKPR